MPFSTSADPYQIEISDDVSAAMDALRPGELRRLMRFLDIHAQWTPMVVVPRSLKELKGNHAGYWEYEIGKLRLIYWVDEPNRTVKLDYLGQHPEWGPRKDKGRLRR